MEEARGIVVVVGIVSLERVISGRGLVFETGEGRCDANVGNGAGEVPEDEAERAGVNSWIRRDGGGALRAAAVNAAREVVAGAVAAETWVGVIGVDADGGMEDDMSNGLLFS